MSFIGIGKLTKYHIYIIVSIICQLISDYSMGLNKMKKPITPKIFKFFAALNNHYLYSNKKRTFTMVDAQKKREEILGGKYIESNYVGLSLVSIFITLFIIQSPLLNHYHLENYLWMLELINVYY